jgi:hypothetical protein
MNSQKVSRFAPNSSRVIEEEIPATHITTLIILPQLQPTKSGDGPSAKQGHGRGERYDSEILGMIPLNCSGTPMLGHTPGSKIPFGSLWGR